MCVNSFALKAYGYYDSASKCFLFLILDMYICVAEYHQLKFHLMRSMSGLSLQISRCKAGLSLVVIIVLANDEC